MFGVVAPTAHVDVDDRELSVRFGPWSLRTPLDNVRALTLAGPYSWWKVGGPARVSMADEPTRPGASWWGHPGLGLAERVGFEPTESLKPSLP